MVSVSVGFNLYLVVVHVHVLGNRILSEVGSLLYVFIFLELFQNAIPNRNGLQYGSYSIVTNLSFFSDNGLL